MLILDMLLKAPHTRHDCVWKTFIPTPLKVIICKFSRGWVLKSQNLFKLNWRVRKGRVKLREHRYNSVGEGRVSICCKSKWNSGLNVSYFLLIIHKTWMIRVKKQRNKFLFWLTTDIFGTTHHQWCKILQITWHRKPVLTWNVKKGIDNSKRWRPLTYHGYQSLVTVVKYSLGTQYYITRNFIWSATCMH